MSHGTYGKKKWLPKMLLLILTKGERLVGTNYDIWHRKIQYLLNKQELLECLEASMDEPDLERDRTIVAQHMAKVQRAKVARKCILVHFGAVLGLEWIAHAWSQVDGRD